MSDEIEELAKAHGYVLAKHAIDLRLKGLPVEQWSEFMMGKIAELATGIPANERATFESVLLAAYGEAIDMRTGVLAMPVAGNA